MNGDRCNHVDRRGGRCGMKTELSDDGLCIWHDPAREEEATRRRSRGGRTTAKSPMRHRSRTRNDTRTVDPSELPGPAPQTIEEAIRFASWATVAVATGQIDQRTGRELGGLLRVFVDGKHRLDRVDERVKRLTEQLKRLQDVKGA